MSQRFPLYVFGETPLQFTCLEIQYLLLATVTAFLTSVEIKRERSTNPEERRMLKTK